MRIQFAVNFAAPRRSRASPPDGRSAKARSIRLTRPSSPVNLAGQVRERGTRRKLSGVEVAVPAEGLPRSPTPGPLRIARRARGHAGDRHRRARLRAAVDRRRRSSPARSSRCSTYCSALYANPYEAVISGEAERREISKTRSPSPRSTAWPARRATRSR